MLIGNGVLLSFFLLLVTALIHAAKVASSSNINQTALSNFTQSTDRSVGSSLSTAPASSWLSPSGRFAFGFYPKGDGFVIGIRLLVSSSNTRVVWTARLDMKPFPLDAVFDFTAQGFFITSKTQKSSTALFNFTSSASFAATSAAMLDNGNFVVYASNSSTIAQKTEVSLVGGVTVTSVTNKTLSTTGQPYNRSCQYAYKCRADSTSSFVIWRSFDYPTDTILGGQSLPCNHNLTSSTDVTSDSIVVQVLSMKCDGNIVFYSNDGTEIWDSGTSNTDDYNSLVLEEDGRLYLSSVGGNEKTLSGYKPQNVEEATMIYVATVGTDKIFRLDAVSLDTNSTQTVNEIPYYEDRCQEKDICGVNSYCWLGNDNPVCSCMPGFESINRTASAGGCQRIIALPSCKSGSSVGNLSMEEVKNIVGLDELAYSVVSAETSDECSSKCVGDCDCYAAVFREQKCSMLKLPLTRGRKDTNYPGVAFIKLAIEADHSHSDKRKREVRVVAIIVCAIVASVIWLAVITACGGAYWHLFVKFREQWEKWELALAEEIAPRYFSYEDIPKDPESIEELGHGAHGTVFKVALPIGGHSVDVAVKRLHSWTGEEAEKDFKAEMSLIGRARHANLVRLLGFCYDGLNRVLVYEYMSRGSLAEHIFNRTRKRLDWARRVRLLLGAARGIHYLHCECENKIIHRDIKPENILISEDWTAKLSDFGLAKHVSAKQTIVATFTVAAGTDGYVAPECEQVDDSTAAVLLSEKADVYSYGVVVLETVCSKRNNKEGDLLKYVRQSLANGETCTLWEGEQVDASVLERVVEKGLLCVEKDSQARPSMEEMVVMLEEVMVFGEAIDV